MTYYANIDSKSVISGFSEVILSRDEYGSTNVQNIEVSETIYNNAQTYVTYYYIYKNTNEEDVYVSQNLAQKLDAKSSDFCRYIK